jgi:hypothetical protein
MDVSYNKCKLYDKDKYLLKKISWIVFVIFLSFGSQAAEWKVAKSGDYFRITDCIVRDIDADKIDEIILSSYSYNEKFVDVYKVTPGKLEMIDRVKVPYFTVFFDVGDLDNNGRFDLVFLTSDGLFYREITRSLKPDNNNLNFIESVKSEIMVPQPELLTDVNLVVDLNGDKKNELVVENIRAIEIFETKTFTRLAKIDLATTLEYALIPGQFYPHYIFYTLPIIQVKDLDNDNKKEIITKFPTTINIYGQTSNNSWAVKNKMYIGSDNVYFLSDAYIKFAFPVIADIDNDQVKEIIVSSANLDMPHLRFEALGDVYYFKKTNFELNKNKKIIVKGIPLNLPYFFNITDAKYKDFIVPVVPFSLISVFGLLSGIGSVKVPFMLFKQTHEDFNLNKPVKLFEISVRIENITSFVEELPLDQYAPGKYPDFYYFVHNFSKRTADILYYYYDEKKEAYNSVTAETLSIPNYDPQLPATLKLGYFSNNIRKSAAYMTHKNLFVLSRVD